MHVGTSKTELVAQRDHSANVVRFFALHHRGGWMVAPRHADCWTHVAWTKLCNRARKQLALHRFLHGVAQHRLDAIKQRELERQARALARMVGTYLGAVAYVERFFGPQPFLRSCPSTEGGYGPWVPNRNGSGAGGWLQFMSGTFYGIIGDAIAAARARGMRVPASAASWYSPLGQALAGRQMLADGRRGEWDGGTC